MGTAHAAPILNDWVFNPTGSGPENGQTINEYLDVNGNSFYTLRTTGDNGFTFTQHAVYNIVQADTNGQLFPINYSGGNITAVFQATGSGQFGGAFRFTGGVLKMYHNPTNGEYGGTNGIYGANLGNLIASFSLLRGGGEADMAGALGARGYVNVVAHATSLANGYFYDSDDTDLAQGKRMDVEFTSVNMHSFSTERLVDEVACQYAGFTGSGCNGTEFASAPREYFFLSNYGQLKWIDLPEPGSLALFGIAMLGASIVRRKHAGRA